MPLLDDDFDLPDPLDAIDRAINRDPLTIRTKKRKKRTAELDPEEEDSILASLGQGAMSGLAYVGGALDKMTGSRALRGILGGKPRELASLIPFSDTIGLTRPEDIVHGTDLIGAPKDTPLFSPEGAAGFGLEVLLDPTLPFTGFFKGGLTASGKALKTAGALETAARSAGSAARKAGEFLGPRVFKQTSSLGKILADPVAHGIDNVAEFVSELERANKGPLSREMLEMPLGGNLEFWPTGTVVGGQGKIGRGIAHGMDVAGDVLRHGNIPGTTFSPGDVAAQLFSGRVAGMGTREFQEAMGQVSDELPAMYGEKLRPVHQLADDLQAIPHDERALMRELEDVNQGLAPSGVPLDRVEPIKSELTKTFAKGVQQGSYKDFLKDPIAKYGVGRRANMGPNVRLKDGDEFTEKVVQTSSGTSLPRSEGLKGLRRGGDTLNEMLQDPNVLAARNADELSDYLSTHWRIETPFHTKEQYDILADTLQGFKHSWDTDALAYTGGNVPNFWRHPIEAAAEASRSSPRRVKYQGAAMKALGEGIKATKGTGPTVPLGSLLDEANIFRGDDEHLGGLAEMARQLGIAPPPPTRNAKELAAWRSAIANTPVPAKYMEDMKRIKGIFESPEEVGKLLDFYDSTTGMFKAGVLTWPARYARDFLSGQFNNIATGQWSLWSVKAGHDFLQAREIDALSLPYIRQILNKDKLPATQENANKVLRAHLAAIGLLHQAKGTSAQIASDTAKQVDRNTLQGLVEAIPGKKPINLTAIKEAFTSGDAWPHHIEGVFGAEETKFAPVRAGNVTGNYIDSMNRLPPYLELLKRGVDPKEAYSRVMAAQVDYSGAAYSAFERGTMTRVAPFYKFSRAMLPFVLGRLLDEPSGRLAQVVRGQARMRENEQFTPSHISQTTAMPIPGAPEGFQRYLTSLGLMHEDPLNLFRPGQSLFKTTQGTLQELGGRLNPLAKMPIEWMAGKQLYSGRELQDLEGNVGRIAANLTGADEAYETPLIAEQLLSNSPLSRVATTVRTLTDPRKGVGAKATNLLSGVRLQDVDKEKSRNIAIRENIEDVLKGQSGVRHLRPHLYVRAEDMDKLSEKEKQLLAIYEQLAAQSQKAARQKKKTAVP